MFSKISRYRKLPDIVTTDAKGRSLPSKSLRSLPVVSGTFLHTVEAGDRLDHLAHKYYKQPRKWWRICDANPELLSPLALLGKEPIVTDRFPLTFSGAQPPWADLVRQLSKEIGVEDIHLVDDIQLAPTQLPAPNQQVTVYVERHEYAVLVTYNRININAITVAEVIVKAGFIVGHSHTIGRVGKQIIIPPDVIT